MQVIGIHALSHLIHLPPVRSISILSKSRFLVKRLASSFWEQAVCFQYATYAILPLSIVKGDKENAAFIPCLPSTWVTHAGTQNFKSRNSPSLFFAQTGKRSGLPVQRHRKVRKGNEFPLHGSLGKMGPVWFFKGWPVTAGRILPPRHKRYVSRGFGLYLLCGRN